MNYFGGKFNLQIFSFEISISIEDIAKENYHKPRMLVRRNLSNNQTLSYKRLRGIIKWTKYFNQI